MKNYSRFLSLAIIIAGVIVSCTKSDPPPSQAQQLVGNWQIVTQVITTCTDPSYNESISTCTTSCTTLAITATTLKITTPVPGSSDIVQDFTYTISGANIITVPASDGKIVFSVTTATSLTIEIVSPATGADANCQQTMVFKRI